MAETTSVWPPMVTSETTSLPTEHRSLLQGAELGVPFALTAAIILVMCFTVMYTRYRRIRLRQRSQPRPPPAVRGAPACAAAYNRLVVPPGSRHFSITQQQLPRPPSYGSSLQPTTGVFTISNEVPAYIAPVPPEGVWNAPPYSEMPSDGPPRYEDVIKEPPPGQFIEGTSALSQTPQSNETAAVQHSTAANSEPPSGQINRAYNSSPINVSTTATHPSLNEA